MSFATVNDLLGGVKTLTNITQKSYLPQAHGGYAKIYRAQLESQIVALKPVNLPMSHEKYKERITREVRVWSRLSHQNILPFLGLVAETGGLTYMVSPWYQNGNINEFLVKEPNADRISLLAQIASGLAYLHSETPIIIHGDLRGANILISDKREAKIADFGLSQLMDDMPYESQSTSLNKAGATRWMAPELLVMQETDGHIMRTMASDIYSFAMTIVEIYSGLVPFSRKNDFLVKKVVLEGTRPSRPSATIDNFGSLLWALTNRCWAHNPTLRPSASDVVEFLALVPDYPMQSEQVDKGLEHISTIYSLKQMTELFPTVQSEAAFLTNLGISLSARFERQGELPDIEASILSMQHAVAITENGDPEMAQRLYQLGVNLTHRFMSEGKLADMDASISNMQHAIALTEDGDMTILLRSQLAKSQRLRSQRQGAFHSLMSWLHRRFWKG